MTLLECGAMRMSAFQTLCTMLILTGVATAQDVIPLYQGTPPGSTQENYPEKQYFSKHGTPMWSPM